MNKCNNTKCDNLCKVKFCSLSCAAKINGSKYPKKKTRFKERKCPRCEKVIVKGCRNKYCSKTCSTKAFTENYIKEWLAGNKSGSEKSGVLSSAVRNYLIEKANNKCSKCFWGEINPYYGKVILTVDHKDGNWQNNTKDNLEVLCYNCHSLTPTFGSLNRGKYKLDRSVGRHKLLKPLDKHEN